MLQEVCLVKPVHNQHLKEHHNVETRDASTEHHSYKECTCNLSIADFELKFIASVHLFIIFLKDLSSLFHISGAFSVKTPSACRPGEK